MRDRTQSVKRKNTKEEPNHVVSIKIYYWMAEWMGG